MIKFKHDCYMPGPDDKQHGAQTWMLVKYDELCERGERINRMSHDPDYTEHIKYIALDSTPEPTEVYEMLRWFILDRPDYWGLFDCTAHPPHLEEERKHPIHVWYSDDVENIVAQRTYEPVLEVRIHDAYLFTIDGDMLQSQIMGTHYGAYELGTHMLGMPDIHSHQTTFWAPKEPTPLTKEEAA